MSKETNQEFENALVEKQAKELSFLKTLLGKTAEDRAAEQADNIETGFNFSSPIIPYYSLFKQFNDEFYFLQIPLGTEDLVNMAGQDFVQTNVIQTKKPYTRFFTYPYSEEATGSLFGSYGRKNDTAYHKYLNEIRKVVKGRRLNENTQQYELVEYKDINYGKQPISVRKTKLILGVVLEKSDIPRTVVNTVLKQEDGLTVTDDNGNPVFEQVKQQVDDFFIAEVGDIFEKGKNTLEKGSPRYKLIWLQLSGKQDKELLGIKARYANNIKNVKLPDGSVVKADFDVKHPTNGCILHFTKKTINNVVEHPIKDIKLQGLLVETKKVNGKPVGFPTELGRDVRDVLLSFSPLKDSFTEFNTKLKEKGKELTHSDVISSPNAIPTLESMKVADKMLQDNQIKDIIQTMKESIDNFLAETFPEKYGDSNVPAVENKAKMSLPTAAPSPHALTQEDKQKAAIQEAEVIVDVEEEEEDDLPF